MRGRGWRTVAVAAVLVGGLPVVADEPVGDEAARQAARRDLEAIGRLIQRGVQELVAEPALPPDGVAGREQQIAQQAQQLERMLRPILNVELEAIRQACGSLEPPARRRVYAAGGRALEATAREFARRQLTGVLGREPFDPRAEIRAGLERELAEVAAADELAAYRQEQAARTARREAAARLAIVAKLDRQLDLSARQRAAIEEDLVRDWQPEWIRELEDRGGMLVNNYRPAPDYAAATIEPHLSADQAAEWRAWCGAAGSRVFGQRFGWNFDGQGLQQPDEWWIR